MDVAIDQPRHQGAVRGIDNRTGEAVECRDGCDLGDLVAVDHHAVTGNWSVLAIEDRAALVQYLHVEPSRLNNRQVRLRLHMSKKISQTFSAATSL